MTGGGTRLKRGAYTKRMTLWWSQRLFLRLSWSQFFTGLILSPPASPAHPPGLKFVPVFSLPGGGCYFQGSCHGRDQPTGADVARPPGADAVGTGIAQTISPPQY